MMYANYKVVTHIVFHSFLLIPYLKGKVYLFFLGKVNHTPKTKERRQQYNKVVIIREGELLKGG